MNSIVLSVLVFSVAAVFELLSMGWLSAREKRDILTGAGLAMAIELMVWAPALVAIQTDQPWFVIPAMLGSGMGAAIALSKMPAKATHTVCPHCGSIIHI